MIKQNKKITTITKEEIVNVRICDKCGKEINSQTSEYSSFCAKVMYGGSTKNDSWIPVSDYYVSEFCIHCAL